MRRFSALFACLMLVLSLGLGSVAHATEGVRCAGTTATSSFEHSEGDVDQVPADAEKDYPHHHGGCHGHHAGVPIAADPVSLVGSAGMIVFAGGNAPKAPVSSDPALRPPQA